MASNEDQEILARIGQLAGQINRHKNAQGGSAAAPVPRYHPYQGPAPSAQAAWGRGGGGHHYQPRGYRVAKMAPHRHRSLVLNSSNGANAANAQSGGTDSGATSDASTGSNWVTKKDRHLQLINPAVYEKEAHARSKAIAETQRQKQRLRDERERSRVFNYVQRLATPAGPAVVRPTNSSGGVNPYEVVVDGIRFHVAKNGSKLVKVADNNAPKATPKTAVVGGVKFYRSRNGNLYRHGAVKAQRRSGPAVSKVNTPCRIFSTTGSCANGPRCRYTHDPTKVAICRDYLKGDCVNGDACDLSHELTPERTPVCVHYAKGNCKNPSCRYTHAQVSSAPQTLVCRAFGLFGYCSKGSNCEDRHVFECPDFSNTGTCKTKGCKLPHRERASVLRKAAEAAAAAAAASDGDDVEMEDVSSDEDGESVDSNDVDSDAVDEFLGQDDNGDPDDAFDTGKEFIQL